MKHKTHERGRVRKRRRKERSSGWHESACAPQGVDDIFFSPEADGEHVPNFVIPPERQLFPPDKETFRAVPVVLELV